MINSVVKSYSLKSCTSSHIRSENGPTSAYQKTALAGIVPLRGTVKLGFKPRKQFVEPLAIVRKQIIIVPQEIRRGEGPHPP